MHAYRNGWMLVLAGSLLLAGCDNKHDGSLAGDSDDAPAVAEARPAPKPAAPRPQAGVTAAAKPVAAAQPVPVQPEPQEMTPPAVAPAPGEPEYHAALDANIPVEERAKLFLQQSEEEQNDTIIAMDGSPSDIALITQLMPEKMSSEIKQSMLDVLEDTDKSAAMPALKTAMGDQNSEVASKAIDVLVFLGDQSDVATLKSVAENAKNEEVRQAAQDAAEMLE